MKPSIPSYLMAAAIATCGCGANKTTTSATANPGGALSEGTGGTQDAASVAAPSPSCDGGLTCNGVSCCASMAVPGGTYFRTYDGVTYTDKSNPATVGDFALDAYEVTVGRFRKFVAGYPANLPSDEAGILSAPGWDASWEWQIPKDLAGLIASIKCDATHQSWTDAPGANENRPMNCITWYEAFAFCAWDGGRLPTEAEWNYAAAGGSEQREYPWSAPATEATLDDVHAVYCGASCNAAQDVGSKSPVGNGKWGHADMAGNVREWTLDSFGDYPNPCTNCEQSAGADRVVRGGAFNRSADQLPVARRDWYPDAYVGYDIGVRCAR